MGIAGTDGIDGFDRCCRHEESTIFIDTEGTAAVKRHDDRLLGNGVQGFGRCFGIVFAGQCFGFCLIELENRPHIQQFIMEAFAEQARSRVENETAVGILPAQEILC